MKYISRQHRVEAWKLEPGNILAILRKYLKDQAEGTLSFSVSFGHQHPPTLDLSEGTSKVSIPAEGYAVRRETETGPKWIGMYADAFERAYIPENQ